jgi:hypothetical protein
MWTFFAEHFWTFIASFGALGIVALIACFVVLGWNFGAVLAAVINAFKAIVEFFETPLGQVVGIVILCAICFFAADIRRTRIDAAKERVDIQNALAQAADTAEKNRVERDKTIKAEVQQDANSKIDAVTAEKNAFQERALEYEQALSNRPACTVTDDDVAADKLRRSSGK